MRRLFNNFLLICNSSIRTDTFAQISTQNLFHNKILTSDSIFKKASFFLIMTGAKVCWYGSAYVFSILKRNMYFKNKIFQFSLSSLAVAGQRWKNRRLVEISVAAATQWWSQQDVQIFILSSPISSKLFSTVLLWPRKLRSGRVGTERWTEIFAMWLSAIHSNLIVCWMILIEWYWWCQGLRSTIMDSPLEHKSYSSQQTFTSGSRVWIYGVPFVWKTVLVL